MNLLVVAFLVVIVVTGYLSTFLFAVPLRVEERLAYGSVLGVVYVSVVGFALSWAAGMDRGSMVATMVVAVAMLAPVAHTNLEVIGADVASVGPRLRLPWREYRSLRPMVVIVAMSVVVSVRILSLAYGRSTSGGVSVGHLSSFGDWSAHLAYAGSFALADNFPPELPTAAGEPFAYHFGVDFFSAMFVPLGLSLQGALQVSSAVLAIAFPSVLYLASMRFTGGRLAAALATVIFLASGGVAALGQFLFVDLLDGGVGVLGNLPRTYAFDGFERQWIDNAVTGFLYPQRPTMIGFPVTLMVLAMLWQQRTRGGHRTHLVAGLLVGIMPIFHVFAFGVLVVIGGFWAVLERTKRWLWFLVPAGVIGAPIVFWQLPSEDGRTFRTFWVLGNVAKAGTPDAYVPWERNPLGFVGFWLYNTGLFIPLAIAGMWLLRERLGPRFWPIVGLLVVPNVAIWHFWEGNNVKYVVFFLLLGAPFVGHVLAQAFKDAPAYKALATLVLVSLTLSGGLDIWRAFEGSAGAYPAEYMRPGDVLVGEWVRDNTEPDAVFATAGHHVHPVRTIAARTVVMGSKGRLNDLGVDWVSRDDDLRVLYGVFEGFDAVIDEYDIDYLVLGPYERSDFRPSGAPDDWDPAIFWDAAAPKVYDIGEYQVYDVRQYQS